MGLEAIYIVRHGLISQWRSTTVGSQLQYGCPSKVQYRSNWTVDASTGQYAANVPSPTGIPSDPALASYGVQQAEQLGQHLLALEPPVDLIYSSPFYRCLQTLEPFTSALSASSSSPPKPVKIVVEPGMGEFYGLARFDHPSPAPITELNRHFRNLHAEPHPTIVPSTKGEGITQLHDRVAYCLDRIIRQADRDPNGPKTLLICTHAAVMICIGRALTGKMPESETEDDFQCFTCAFSKFVRRGSGSGNGGGEKGGDWEAEKAEDIPDVGWRDGKGVGGGWDCKVNGDCSFLAGGEERGWSFAMEVQQQQHAGK